MSEQLATPCKKFGHTGGRYKGGRCKECKRLWNKKWYKLNPEKKKAADRARYKLNPEKRRAAGRAWSKRNPDKARECEQRKRAKQRGYPTPTRPMPESCELCSGPPNGRYGSLHLDHDHRTGKFRGWLCSRCNVSLGGLGDSVEGLNKAIGYLTRVENYGTLPETMAKAKGD